MKNPKTRRRLIVAVLIFALFITRNNLYWFYRQTFSSIDLTPYRGRFVVEELLPEGFADAVEVTLWPAVNPADPRELEQNAIDELLAILSGAEMRSFVWNSTPGRDGLAYGRYGESLSFSLHTQPELFIHTTVGNSVHCGITRLWLDADRERVIVCVKIAGTKGHTEGSFYNYSRGLTMAYRIDDEAVYHALVALAEHVLATGEPIPFGQ